ncbi:MAG: right-handed parallel beta-helix repeat-containing protein [Candidatus Cloacimonetes bacterium]|nr:right-handed parallel beta-helix repeat-containing protein [Candidatus Cloacimonadota bacterium]
MRKRLVSKIFIVLFTLVFFAIYTFATTINIPADYTTIQAGIDVAVGYDTVLVDTGTYVENLNFGGKNITVASYYLTTEDSNYIEQTIIDGDQDGHVIAFNNEEDTTAVLAGFTVRNGYAYSRSLPNYGGGIFCSGASPTLQHLIVKDNAANLSGGGIYCYNGASPHISYVIISNNTAVEGGGGIYCDEASPLVEHSMISNNSADNYGGGILLSNASPSLEYVAITDNSATNEGGGVYCSVGSQPEIVNATIANNFCGTNGAGIYCIWSSSPQLKNTIVSDNLGNYGIYVDDDGGNPGIEYSNFYNNGSGNFYGVQDTIGVNVTTNTNGDTCDVYYNIQLDPLFADANNGDYNLTENSPCIDAGDPASPLDPDATFADMGAYYYDQTPLIPPSNLNIEYNGGTVTIQWDPVTGAGSYTIYESDSPYSGFSEVDTTTNTYWSTGAGAEKKFYYITVKK